MAEQEVDLEARFKAVTEEFFAQNEVIRDLQSTMQERAEEIEMLKDQVRRLREDIDRLKNSPARFS